jgi:hypothetical protein
VTFAVLLDYVDHVIGVLLEGIVVADNEELRESLDLRDFLRQVDGGDLSQKPQADGMILHDLAVEPVGTSVIVNATYGSQSQIVHLM